MLIDKLEVCNVNGKETCDNCYEFQTSHVVDIDMSGYIFGVWQNNL